MLPTFDIARSRKLLSVVLSDLPSEATETLYRQALAEPSPPQTLFEKCEVGVRSARAMRSTMGVDCTQPLEYCSRRRKVTGIDRGHNAALNSDY